MLTTVLLVAALSVAIIVAGGLALGNWSRLLRNTVFIIIPLNALADILIMTSRGAVLHSGYVRAILIAAVIVVSVPLMRLDRVTVWVFVFLAYLFPLTLLSSNVPFSISIYFKFALSVMMLPLARVWIRTPADLVKLNRGTIAGVCILVVTFGLFQVFKLGSSVYMEGVYTHEGTAKFTAMLAYAVILGPFMALMKGGRLGLLSGWALGGAVLVVLLVFQRTGIAAMLAGLVVLWLYGFMRGRLTTYALIGALAGSAFLFVVAPTYGDILSARAEQRMSLEQDLSSQGGRVAETKFVLQTVKEAGPVQLLFGTELFNGGQLFGWYKGKRLRPLHIDYNIILLGSGFIGFGLYSGLLILIAVTIMRQTRGIRNTPFGKGLRASFWSLLAATLIVSAGSQIWSITPLSLVFLYFGAFLGVTSRLPKPGGPPSTAAVRPRHVPRAVPGVSPSSPSALA